MFKKIGQTIKSGWEWVKDKTIKLWKTIVVVVVGGVAIATVTQINPPIPVELQLECDRADVLESYQRTKYKREIVGHEKKMKEGKEVNVPIYENVPQYDYVEYACKTNKKIAKVDKEFKRTNKTLIRLEKVNEDGSIQYSVESGHPQYFDGKDWYKVEFATTSVDAFERQTLSFIGYVFAADTGWESPSAHGGGGGKGGYPTMEDWTTPANAYSSNDQYAILPHTGAQEYQSWEGFGFDIPSGSTIDGVQASVEWHYEGTGSFTDSYLKYWSASDNKWADGQTNPGWTGTDATYYVGGSDSLWSRTPIDTDFSDANFSFHIVGKSSNSTLHLDHLQVKVYYTEAPAGGLIIFD